MARQLLAEMGNNKDLYSLKLLVKTHNPPGAAKCRAVHSGAGQMFRPLADWVMRKLRPITKRLPYMANNSKEVAQ